MPVQTQRVTVEEFERIAALPENADRRLEYVEGEIVEVVSNNHSSEIAATIFIEIGIYLKKNRLGRLTTTDGGYIVSGERYTPDVAFISFEKQPESSHAAYNPTPPDLAVEVLSPNDQPAMTRIKVVNYLRAGVMVWIVDPERQRVEVYAPDQPPRVLDINATLDGGSVLPGFALPVKAIFPD